MKIVPTIEIGCGQITWSNDTPEEQVLAEIAQAGYAGAPAGPSKGRTAEQAQALFARHGLKPAPGYLGVDFWRADLRASILERASAYAAFMREVGCTELYVAAGGFTSCVTSSGRSRPRA
jgi:inosose dehydratase